MFNDLFNNLFNNDKDRDDPTSDFLLGQFIPGYRDYRWFRRSPKSYIGCLIATAVLTLLVAIFILGSIIWIFFLDNDRPQPKKTSQYSLPQIQTELTIDERDRISPSPLTVQDRLPAGSLLSALGMRAYSVSGGEGLNSLTKSWRRSAWAGDGFRTASGDRAGPSAALPFHSGSGSPAVYTS